MGADPLIPSESIPQAAIDAAAKAITARDATRTWIVVIHPTHARELAKAALEAALPHLFSSLGEERE